MHRELMWGAQYPEGTLSGPRWLRPLHTAPPSPQLPRWLGAAVTRSTPIYCSASSGSPFPRVSGCDSWIQEGAMDPQAAKGWGRTPCTFMRRPCFWGAQAASVAPLTSNACPAHRPRPLRVPRAWFPTPSRSLLDGITRGRNSVLPLAAPQGGAWSAGPMRLASGSPHPRNASSGPAAHARPRCTSWALNVSVGSAVPHARASSGPRPVP
ncbi:hypothetical protein NDU88_004864 [Pleurodeles waltl]|uniref:Uncharacterized protein n=1 Tax=Pleurodeles waltl TaxID=8319 RepID=A0AAV7W9U0_PLEWA|nr:hypothetical protein NDU88_004864 [Pleurodeles waltl]